MQNEDNVGRIWLATDLHYLSHGLTDEGPLFQKLVEKADGKLTERSPELLDALIAKAEAEKPDALILAGDLTFNGERQSLLEIIEKLNVLVDEGIPVLVIPGNHDINYPYTCSYYGEKAAKVPNITQQAFAAACAGLGPKLEGTISVCPDSFSYVWELKDICRILCLDANTQANPGGLDEKTIAWAAEELEKAKRDRVPVISVTHQNVLRQSSLIYKGFVMNNEEEVRRLLTNGGVKTNLNGHSHIQHESKEEASGLTDYCTSCLVTWPLHFAEIQVYRNGKTVYTVRKLEAYEEEARKRFEVCTGRQMRQTLSEFTIPEAEKEEMVRFGIQVNQAFFSGVPFAGLKNSRGWQLWKQYAPGTFWYYYINTLN